MKRKWDTKNWVNRLLNWICEPNQVEGIIGDLEEIYEDHKNQYGKKKANLFYATQAIGFLKPFAWKKKSIQSIISLIMFRNHLKIAFRNILKSKVYSIINITGITVSFACCLLIGIYIQHELSYDKYHKNYQNIYRLANHEAGASYENGVAKVFELWAPEAEKIIPGILATCRFVFYGQALIKKDDRQFYQSGGLYADSTVFELFDWNLIEGDPQNLLNRPNQMIITQTMAEKYFPDENPVGKILNVNNQDDLIVVGVIDDVPDNSHFNFNFLVSLITYVPPDRGNKWSRWNQYYSYLLLSEDQSIEEVENKIDQLIGQHIEEDLALAWTPFLQPIESIHLESKLHREMSPNADKSYVYIIGFIALFILLIACTNFVNLSTARATQRAKEVGVRKVIGASKFTLIQQFLSESMIVTFMGAVLAVFLAKMLIAPLGLFLGQDLELNLLGNSWLWAGLIFMTLITGLISGSYPRTDFILISPGTSAEGANQESFISERDRRNETAKHLKKEFGDISIFDRKYYDHIEFSCDGTAEIHSRKELRV